MYVHYIKRCLDFLLALVALTALSPFLLVVTLVSTVKLQGHPFFLQIRPGKDEKLFKMIKFRSMTNERDENGELLPDEQRLTSYGHALRATSVDELPELVNILLGQMSFVGPRPQLVRDMVFMTTEERRRHTVRPGLTGLAQVSGRNALRWENKLALDLKYISDMSFRTDVKLLFRTAKIILFGGESSDETEVTDDYGDYLLQQGRITEAEYRQKREQAKELLEVKI